MKRVLCIVLLLLALILPAIGDEEVTIFSQNSDLAVQSEIQPEITVLPSSPAQAEETPLFIADESAKDELIDRMIDLAQQLFKSARGRAMPANSSGDIYVCKNFVVHLFRENRDGYRMAAYPDVPLVIPNNLPAKESKPFYYGITWEEIGPEQGNPFEAAYSFYYNADESKEENRRRAIEFMKEVKRGDFFQMSAQYYYGVGAHSLVFIEDYDPDTNTVTWTDSNMKGESRGGKRYGYVQFDANKDIEWFVDAFCKKGRGATLYRLRDDIIKK